ncbi:MAG TPA: mechanosensitive ion channel [Planctomycetes bacterium]|nr:mechanosensitive ion channel [Planctomycetota bacterium]
MSPSRIMSRAIVLGFLFFLSAPLLSQSLTDEAATIDQLETRLKAADKEAVTAAMTVWVDRVRSKEAELVALVEKRSSVEGDEKSRLEEQIDALRTERDALADKAMVIVKAAKAQGVDGADANEAFLSGLSTHLDLKDPNALLTFALNWIKSPQGGIKWGLNILAFFAIIIGFKILSRIAGKVVAKTMKASRMQVSDLLRDFFINTVRKTVYFIGIMMALGQIGIDIGPLLAGIGVMGFVVGFALQGTLSNFASGIMILLYRPYDIGDVVSAAGATGKVTAMSLVSTTLTTPDNQIVVIPNSSIWGGVITNITGNDTRRVDLVFGIGYDDDIGLALRVLEDIVTKHPKVLESPAPVVQLHELADSSVNFVVRPWSKTSDYWTVYWDITKEVKERFDKEGLSIPYPQQDIHLHGLPTDAA